MADYNAEFQRIFGGGVGCSVSGHDWNTPRYFDALDNECYQNEAALVSSLTSEAYNKYGFEVDYYVKVISTKRDELMGEDPLEYMDRRFKLKVYTEQVPNLQKQYAMQGMIYTEIITVQATIAHFDEASQYDYAQTGIWFDKAVPKIGDLMYFQYCDKFYEVINVKPFADGSTFLGVPITYQFSLRVWRNNHEDVFPAAESKSLADEMAEFEHYASLAESFDIQHGLSTVNISGGIPETTQDLLAINDELKKEDVALQVYKESNITNDIFGDNTDDPFGGW